MASSVSDARSPCIRRTRRNLFGPGYYTSATSAPLLAHLTPHTSECENFHHAWCFQAALKLDSCLTLGISDHTLSATPPQTSQYTPPPNLAGFNSSLLGSVFE